MAKQWLYARALIGEDLNVIEDDSMGVVDAPALREALDRMEVEVALRSAPGGRGGGGRGHK